MTDQESRDILNSEPWIWFVGLATMDVIQRVENWPSPNDKVTSTWQEVAPGGPATNAALACSALGGKSRLGTGLGLGTVGATIFNTLETRDVTVDDWAPKEAMPSLSSIILTGDTGARAIVSSDATGMDLSPPEIPPDLANCAALLLDGHHPRIARWAAGMAHEKGVRVILDAGRWKPVMEVLLPLADDVVCSADFTVPGTTDRQSMMDEILRRGTRRVAVTDGAGPIAWRERGQNDGEITGGEIQVPTVTAVDTLAAGDVFHGAYVYAVAQLQLAFAPALELASEVAACKVQRLGQQEWLKALENYPM
ncbi:PfkB family carbohydrate kinase [Paeniglutamicibacter sulfureus]|uniref:PfkB family carbohydrate kinase n=1 Tax=Paeniglutamicibacter sulfureus TaxID=43666 RepID=UPI00286CB5C2|nr:PfkB family carbohydrate kinase [Paeniglutamicibacter sulfureus]